MRILLADDSMFFRAIESKFLQKPPVEILEARDCAEAFEIVRKKKPSLVYMSFSLPQEGGVWCCRMLKNDPLLRATPVILVCDQSVAGQPEEAKMSGCDAYLVKPLDRHSFLQAGRRFLDGIREHRHPSFFSLTITSGREEFRGKCLDICGGGMFIETQAEVAVGTLVNMQFKLPGGPATQVVCSGEVMWLNRKPNPLKSHYPNGLGIKFVGLSDTIQKTLARLTEKQPLK
jgi:CheY-like chemotaxis protein